MNDGLTDASHKRSLSPWMLIVAIVLAALIAALVVVSIVALILPEGRRFPRGIADAALDDGSVLVLHDLTHGSRHEIELPVQDNSWPVRLGFSAPRTEKFSVGFPTESLGLWFSRYDPETGEVIPFDRWSYCIAETDNGERVTDERYARRESRTLRGPHGSSSSSMSSTRPFDPIDPGHHEHIVYHSGLPVLRPVGDTFRLEVYHADDGLIATLEVPFPPGVGSFPVWSSESLPVTKSDGDLDVALTKLSADPLDGRDSQPHQRIRIRPELSVRQNGEATEIWSDQRMTLEDAMGNRDDLYDCRLSPRESAWQLNVRLFRDERAPFDSHQRLTIEDIPIPLRDQSVPLAEMLTYDGVAVELLGIGGPGTVEHRFSSKQSRQSHSSPGSDSAGDYDIRVEYDGAKSRAIVTAERAHVLLKVLGDTPDHKVDVLLTDQNGLRQNRRMHHLGEVRVALLDPDDLLTHANVYVIVHRGRFVEFRVAPPSISDSAE